MNNKDVVPLSPHRADNPMGDTNKLISIHIMDTHEENCSRGHMLPREHIINAAKSRD